MKKHYSKKHYNIITSCDNNLAAYVAVGITAIASNLKDANIDYYLLHSRIDPCNIEMLQRLCDEYNNITFHEIVVPDPEAYEELAKYGGGWSGEAYYALCAHQLLPETADRALYLDAGDTLVLGDIEPYYNYDFQGNSLIVTGGRYKVSNGEDVLYEPEDLGAQNFMHLSYILRGIFNSGSYVLNLDKMRRDNLSLQDFLYLAGELVKVRKDVEPPVYFGDQGLLSAAFVGDVRYYRYPEIRALGYMPYNFCLWFYNFETREPNYRPVIIHFAGDNVSKPWSVQYPVLLERFQTKEGLRPMEDLRPGQARYYNAWQKYAMMTEQILAKADTAE